MANLGYVQVKVMYGECMRNHALHVPAYSRDGCGFYEPSAPDEFACAVCGCHRSFHRKFHVELPAAEVDEPALQQEQQQEEEQEQEQEQQEEEEQQQPLAVVAVPEAPPQRRPRITQEQSEQIRAVVEANDWKMFREYSSADVVRICSEIGIHRMTLKSWISTHRRRRLNNIEDHA